MNWCPYNHNDNYCYYMICVHNYCYLKINVSDMFLLFSWPFLVTNITTKQYTKAVCLSNMYKIISIVNMNLLWNMNWLFRMSDFLISYKTFFLEILTLEMTNIRYTNVNTPGILIHRSTIEMPSPLTISYTASRI